MVAAVGLIGCPAQQEPADAGTPQAADSGARDIGAAIDLGPFGSDAGPLDAAQVDAGASDGGAGDAGPPFPGTYEYRGMLLYRRYCAMCHGLDGEGYVADNANQLANQNFLASATDVFLRESIEKGRPGTPMAPWGSDWEGPLGRWDAYDMVDYMRLWQTEPDLDLPLTPITGDALAGAEIYAARCVQCHGYMGAGVTAMSLNNTWFLDQASDAFIRYAIADGRPDTPMPAFANDLTEQQINDLVALIRSWATETPEPPPPFEADLGDHLINPDGPPAVFTLIDDRFVPADDVYAAVEAGQRVIILDARAASDYLIGHINGAVSIPFYRIEEATLVLPHDTFIVVYCGCPHALSGRALDALRAAGFNLSAVLDEGYYYWRDHDYGVAIGRDRFAPNP
jgi:cytochrome c oxidase cbb3-type subunit 3